VTEFYVVTPIPVDELRCKPAVVLPGISGLNSDETRMCDFCVCCVLCGCGLRDEFIIRSEESYRLCVGVCVCVCLIKCDLGIQQTGGIAQSWSVAQQIASNLRFTDRTSKCNLGLLPALRQFCCFSPVGHFIGQISEYGVPVQAKQVFTRIPGLEDNIVCFVVTLINLAKCRK
jgi:hypothetical protein